MTEFATAKTDEGDVLTITRDGKYDMFDGEAYDLLNQEAKLILDFTLTDVNDIRTALAIGEGKMDSLPKGVRSNPQSCVMARALSNGWKSYIGTTEVNLYHPKDGMTEAQVNDAHRTLKQMGFTASLYDGKYAFDDGSDEVTSWDEDLEDEDLDQDFQDCWKIWIQNTMAMEVFISLFDHGKIPELLIA